MMMRASFTLVAVLGVLLLADTSQAQGKNKNMFSILGLNKHNNPPPEVIYSNTNNHNTGTSFNVNTPSANGAQAEGVKAPHNNNNNNNHNNNHNNHNNNHHGSHSHSHSHSASHSDSRPYSDSHHSDSYHSGSHHSDSHHSDSHHSDSHHSDSHHSDSHHSGSHHSGSHHSNSHQSGSHDVIYHTNSHNEHPYEHDCERNKLPPFAMILGTSNSRVAVKRHREDVEVILNEEGCCHSHSFVAVTGTKCTEIVVGPRARLLAILDPSCAILDVKRLIGLSYEQIKLYIQKYNMPYDVVCHQDGRPQLLISTQGMTRSFYIEDVVAQIFAYMKRLAERRLCGRAKGVVITVPAMFTMTQRHTLKEACRRAGVKVIEIVCEISAAARAAALVIHERHKKDCNFAVIKVGGGYTEVALLNIKRGNVEVKAQRGASIGGNDIDLRLFNHFVSQFKESYNRDPTNDPLAVYRLKLAVELVKKTLDDKHEASIGIDDFYDGITFNAQITRSKFEHLCEDIFESIVNLLRGAVHEAHVNRNDVKQVILYGLQTRTVRIREIIQHYFKHPELMWTYHHAAIEGAALMASSHHGRDFDRRTILGTDLEEDEAKDTFAEVTQQRFGVEVEGGEMTLLIEPNIPLPVNVTRSFTTTVADQTDALIKVFEGDKKMTADNEYVAELQMKNLQVTPEGKTELIITFEMNKKNELRVMVCEKDTENHVEKTITEPEMKARNIDDMEPEIEHAEWAIKTMEQI